MSETAQKKQKKKGEEMEDIVLTPLQSKEVLLFMKSLGD